MFTKSEFRDKLKKERNRDEAINLLRLRYRFPDGVCNNDVLRLVKEIQVDTANALAYFVSHQNSPDVKALREQWGLN